MSPLFLTLGLMLGIGVAVPAVASPHARRQLLVFAPDAPSPALAEQQRLLAGERAALRERDLDVIEVGDAAPLRRRYAVAAGAFAVLLIGKDGGVKLRSKAPIAPLTLVETIDAMPMRQDELQRSRRGR